MGSATNGDTIIKRRKIVKASGHHGGAWKVAYADFVTAMMAFFLLMWLLNATTEEQRKGIADYFSPTIPVSRISGGGSDGLNGSSIFTEETYAKMGTGATRRDNVAFPDAETQTDGRQREDVITEQLSQVKERLASGDYRLSEHLLVKMSPEGIVLEITDAENSPLFKLGRSDPSELLTELISAISDVFSDFEEDVKIIGHTDSLQFRSGHWRDNWSLSADRANTARRLLLEHGVVSDRIVEVAGRADTEPLAPDDPTAAQNRRISITILTR